MKFVECIYKNYFIFYINYFFVAALNLMEFNNNRILTLNKSSSTISDILFSSSTPSQRKVKYQNELVDSY